MLTAERRLWGHSATGPSGVRDQSSERMRSPISPPPASHSVVTGFAGGVGSVPIAFFPCAVVELGRERRC